MTGAQDKEQAVPVVGVEEAVERLTAQSLKSEAEHVGFRASGYVLVTQGDLRTILQALQGSSLRDTHRATEQPVVGWRPIESAPKDGTEVLIYRTKRGVALGWWDADKYAKTPRPYWTGPDARVAGVATLRADAPTHWMPLPAGPSDSGEAALGGDEAEGGVNQDLQAQLKAAYEALERIAHPEYGLGFNKLRGIARQALARRGEG